MSRLSRWILALISLSCFVIFPTVKNILLSPFTKLSRKKFLFQHGTQHMEDRQMALLDNWRAFAGDTNADVTQRLQYPTCWSGQANGVQSHSAGDLHGVDHVAGIAGGAQANKHIAFTPVRVYLLGIHHISRGVVSDGGEQRGLTDQ